MALSPHEHGASNDRNKNRNWRKSGKDYLKAAADKHYILEKLHSLIVFLLKEENFLITKRNGNAIRICP